MVSNSPAFRRAIYICAVVAQAAAFFLRAGDPSGAWSGAMQNTANFLGAIAGVTAMGNISVSSAGATTARHGSEY